MMLTLLLLALTVSGAGVWASKRSPALGNSLMVVGVLSLGIVSVVQIERIISPPQSKTTDRSEMAVSYRLANCVLSDLGGQSGTVILLFPPRVLMDETTEQSYEDGFVMPLRHGHSLLHLKALKLEVRPGKAGYELADFQKVLEQAPHALSIVSYAGVPASFDALFSAGQPKTPPFYVLDSAGTTNWLGPLKDGHIRAVVLPRPGADRRARAEVRGRPEEIFDQFYLLATQETADQVAAQMSAK